MNAKSIAFVLIMSLLDISCYAQELWVGKDGNIRNVEARAMLISEDARYFATRRELYKSIGIRTAWKEVFSLPSGNNEINCLAGSGIFIFIGTKRGLFRSVDGGGKWENVFRAIIPEKNNIICAAISRYRNGEIFIGTKKGIFSSDCFGSGWRDISFNLKNKAVKCVGISKDTLYIAVEDGLYCKKQREKGWKRLYVKSPVENNDAVDEENTAQETDMARSVSCIAFRGSRIYMGAGRAVLYSDDGGKAWLNFAGGGLGGNINYILTALKTERLFSATDKGVFEYDKEKVRWVELYKGMDRVTPARSILFDSADEKGILALTDGGMYRLESGSFSGDQMIDVERNLSSLRLIFGGEPSFRDLQQAALRFNEVAPEKIKNWRREARMRALMPKVSVGYDSTRATNSEIYTSATKDYFTVGPDDLRNGFDVSVSWELADLIWSDDQTNIDVRSRLTTQLRNDILEDLRRAYYERKRLQFEMTVNPPSDMKSRFEKELRIQELTQSIDDITGNYLSDHISRSGQDS